LFLAALCFCRGSSLIPNVARSIRAPMTLFPRHPNSLVQLLREAQAEHGWLPRPLLSSLAGELGLTLAHVEGVASFYRFLHLQPVGRFRILFSDNITDRMLGSEALMAELCTRLRVQPGVVRADGRVSVAPASCTGLGDQGPALLINHHQVVTRLDAERVARIAELVDADVPASQWPAEWSVVADNVRRPDVLLSPAFAPGEALAAALARGVPGTLAEVQRANLRGRGGAGFATGTKWELCRKASGERDRKSTRLNSSHRLTSRMPSSA
jgi:[NiFe] hydrogenase diaphorase moiety large subunit